MTLRTSKMSFKTNLNLEIARKSENETKKRKRIGKKILILSQTTSVLAIFRPLPLVFRRKD